LDSEYLEAYHNRGYAYEKMGDIQQAVEDFRNAAQWGDRAARAYLRSKGIGWER
jgi:tetratricopeptide (TPR) repeat protein